MKLKLLSLNDAYEKMCDSIKVWDQLYKLSWDVYQLNGDDRITVKNKVTKSTPLWTYIHLLKGFDREWNLIQMDYAWIVSWWYYKRWWRKQLEFSTKLQKAEQESKKIWDAWEWKSGAPIWRVTEWLFSKQEIVTYIMWCMLSWDMVDDVLDTVLFGET